MDTGTGTKSPHILILEDDNAHRDLALRAFQEDPETYRISIAGNIREARQLIERDPPDLIIADWLLPDGKGIDILPRRDGLVTVPLIIMTSHGDERLAVELMKTGAIDYVVKSSTMFRELPHIARNALRDWENIVQRQRAEENLRVSEEKFRSLVEYSLDPILILDFQGTILLVNNAAARMTEAGDPAGLIGRNVMEFIAQESQEAAIRDFKEVASGHDAFLANYRVVSLQGKKSDVESLGKVISYDGRPATIISLRNVTERKRAEEALAESENRFRQIAENVGEWIWEVDGDGLYTYSSSAVENILGYRPDEIVGRLHFYDLFTPEVKEVLKKAAMEAFATKEPFRDFVNPNLHKNGNRVILETRGVPRLDEQGRLLGYRGADMDITDRRRAEDELHAKERELALIYRNVSEPLFFLSVEGNDRYRFLTVNQSFLEVTGLSEEQVVGRYVHEVIPEPSLTLVLGKYQQAIQDKTTVVWEETTEYPSGKKYGEVRITPLTDAAGHCTNLVGSVHDVTGHMEAEEALRKSEAQLRTLVQTIPDLVWLKDPDGVFLSCNQRFESLYGAEEKDIIGKTDYDFVDKDLADFFRQHDRAAMAAGEPTTNEEELTFAKDGHREILETIKTPIHGSNGELIGVLGIGRDITERKKMEDALRESEARLDLALRSAEMGVWSWDIVTDRRYFDDQTCHLLGIDPAGFSGTPEEFFSVVHPDDRGVLKEALNRTLEHDVLYDPVYRAVWPDGSIHVITARGRVAKDAAGKPARINGIIWDITERTLAEEALHKSEERLRLAQGAAHAGSWEWDLTTNENIWSDELWPLYGLEINSCAPSYDAWRDTIHPDDRSRVEKDVTDAARNGTELNTEWRTNPGNGPVRWLMSRGKPIRNAEGRAERLIGIVVDITERKQAEEKLRESEEKFRALVNGAGIGVGYWSPDGVLLYLNEISLKRLKAKEDDFIGKPAHEIFGETEGEMYLGRMRQASVSAEPLEFEDRVTLPSGTGWYFSVYSRIASPDGRVMGIQVLSLDITRRKGEEDLRKSYETRLASAMEIGNLAWWEMALPGGEIRFDDRKATMLGYSPEQFRHYTDFTALLHPDDFEPAMQAMRDHLEGKDPKYHTDYRIRTAAGNYRWFRDIGGITGRNPDGSPATVTGIVMDITASREADEKLRESEERYRSVIENAAEGIVVIQDALIQYANPRALEMLPADPEKIHNQPFSGFVYPEDRALVLDRYEHRLRGEDPPQQYDFRILGVDGKIIWVHISAVLIQWNNRPATLNFLTDITERKQAEETLRESENRFRALIQNSSDIIRVLDRHGRIIYESPSNERVLGYPEGSLIGRDPIEYIHPDDLPTVKKELQEVFDRKNTGIPTEFRIRKADGEYIWVDSLGVNLLDVPGVNGIVITTRPIQQRKEAEQILNESRELLRLALEGADAAFWDWDLTTGKAIFSDRFYTMLGYTPGEFPATYDAWVALMHPDDREHVLPDLQRQIREKRPLCEIEYRLLSKDGDWIWILGRGKIVEVDDKGTPARLTGVNIDITNRRLMESEIRSLNTVLEQRVKDRTEALQKANEALEVENAQRVEAESKLKAAYDEKVMLIKEIHHRVKNNLQIIISLLNLQSRYITDESTLAAIKESQNRVRAMSLVHEKLYQADNVSKIQIRDYIRFLGNGLVQFYGAKSRGVRLTLDIGDIDATINTAIPLGLIVNELVSNSLKYAFPEGRPGEITIAVTKEGTALHLRYRDNGVGIPETLDWKNTKSLGLRLVNTLVDQLNGTVELDRSAGTQFTMVLNEKE